MATIGLHFIFSAYGFWLPNDPRGSWSSAIRQFNLLRFGQATKTTSTQSLAHRPHDRSLRKTAKAALLYPPVRFTGEQARAVAHGFAKAANERDYIIHALAILPDHAHLVMRAHRRHYDLIAAHFKARATQQLVAENLHPLAAWASPAGRRPSPWCRNHWCPFIHDHAQMRIVVRYVRANPVKAGLRPQRWSMVKPYGR